MNDYEDLRSQIIDAVKQMFDSQQALIARGKPPDAQRLLMTIELLTKLLPPAAADAPAAPEHAGAKERLLALIGNEPPAREAELAAEIEGLKAENERLRQTTAVQPAPSEQKASPASDAAPAKKPWTPPESWKKGPPEIWRSWMGDGMTWPRMRTSDWGPG